MISSQETVHHYEDYYDAALNSESGWHYGYNSPTDSKSWMDITRCFLTIVLKVGFLLVQVSSVPVNDVNLILLQNSIDFCWSTLTYLLIGYAISHNVDRWGPIENGAVAGWQASVACSSIGTCGIVGRAHTVGYLIIGLLLTGLSQPLIVNWTWSGGWMSKNELNESQPGFRDYAGSGVVHLVGALTGTIGCFVLGRRILRLKDLDNASVAASSSYAGFAGQLLIFAGFMGLLLPNSDKDKNSNLPKAITNTLLAASSCSLIVVGLHFAFVRESFDHWTVTRCLRAATAGLVSVSAGANLYSPLAAVAIGCCTGVLFYFASRRIFSSALEDYCDILSTHLLCGIIGCLVMPLTAIDGKSNFTVVSIDFAWQSICVVSIFTFVTIVMLPMFVLLNTCGILRNKSEYLNHLRAIIALGNQSPKSFMQRIFRLDQNAFYLQPGSNVENLKSDAKPITDNNEEKKHEESNSAKDS